MCSVCGHREHRNDSLRPLRRGRLVVRPQQGKALVHVWGINPTGRVPSQYLKFPMTALPVTWVLGPTSPRYRPNPAHKENFVLILSLRQLQCPNQKDTRVVIHGSEPGHIAGAGNG